MVLSREKVSHSPKLIAVSEFVMKVREVVKLIEDDGWYLVRTKGTHRQFRHPSKPGIVTVSGNLGKGMPPGTLNSVLKQAQLKE